MKTKVSFPDLRDTFDSLIFEETVQDSNSDNEERLYFYKCDSHYLRLSIGGAKWTQNLAKVGL